MGATPKVVPPGGHQQGFTHVDPSTPAAKTSESYRTAAIEPHHTWMSRIDRRNIYFCWGTYYNKRVL